jgi:hypothetical protein
MNNLTTKLIGYVGVDSGQLMITDPCYLTSFKSDHPDSVIDLDEARLHPPIENLPYSYGGACAGSCSSDQAAVLNDGDGIVFRTGFGDGLYPVIAEYEDTGFSGIRVKSVTIHFFDDLEEDLEEVE